MKTSTSSIESILNEHLGDGDFMLPAKVITNPGWQIVAPLLFPDGALSLRGAQIHSTESGSIIVSGHTEVLNSNEAEVVAEFNALTESKLNVQVAVSFDEGSEPKLSDLISLFMSSVNDVPSIALSTLQVTADPDEERYSLLAALADWNISIGSTKVIVTDVQLQAERNKAGKFNAALSGSMSFGKTRASVNAKIADPVKLEGSVPLIPFEDLVNELIPAQTNLPEILEDLRFEDVEISITPSTKDFAMGGKCIDVLSLDIGVSGISVNTLEIEIQSANDSKISGMLTGRINFGGVDFDLVYNVPGDFKFTSRIPKVELGSVVKEICGDSVFNALGIPNEIADIQLKNATVDVNPTDKTIAILALTDLGPCEVAMGKNKNQWDFVVGVQPPENIELSKIDKSLRAFDDLSLSGIRLIVSSLDSKILVLQSIQVPAGGVKKGLNVYASLSLDGLGVDQLLGIDDVVVQGAVGRKKSQASLSSIIGGQFPLGRGVSFGDITFLLKPALGGTSVQLQGTLSVKLGNDNLDFVFETEVQPRGATGAGSMRGDWIDALGIKSVILSNVALEFGASFAPLLPTIGVAGELQVGTFEGAAAVKFDSAKPSKSMIAASFNELLLEDVVETFCKPIYGVVPKAAWDSFLNIGMENVEVYIVPQATEIGDLVFEAGFRMNGTVMLLGWRGSSKMEISYDSGILMEAKLDPLSVGKVLTISGAKSNKDPSLMYVEASPTSSVVDVSCAVSLLGVRQSLTIKGSENGFNFKITQDYGRFMHISLKCALLSGIFEADGYIDFELNLTVGPLKVAGVTVIDRIRLVDVSFEAAAVLKVTTEPSFYLLISGEFEAYGAMINFPTLKIDVSVDDFNAVLVAVTHKIKDEAEELFKHLFSTPAEWARAIGEETVEFAGDVANVLKNGFKQSANQCAQIMKDMGRGLNEIGRGLKDVYGMSAKSATRVFRFIKANVNDVGEALKTVFRISSNVCAQVMKSASYGAKSVAEALKNAYKLGAKSVAAALSHAAFSVKEVGKWVEHYYKVGKETMARFLRDLRYAAPEMAESLQYVYKVGGKEVAKLLKGAGFAANEVAEALSDVFSMGAKEVMEVMKDVGYAADEIYDGMVKAGKWTENALEDAAKAVGNFFDDIFGPIPVPGCIIV